MRWSATRARATSSSCVARRGRLLCTRMGMRRLRPHPAARLQEMYSLDVLDPSGKLYPEEVPRFVKGPPTFS